MEETIGTHLRFSPESCQRLAVGTSSNDDEGGSADAAEHVNGIGSDERYRRQATKFQRH